MEQLINGFLVLMSAYFVSGVLFGIYFIYAGAQKLDEGVNDTPWHFRLLLLPGSVLLWVVLLIKIVNKKS